jgi:hypothetical protein
VGKLKYLGMTMGKITNADRREDTWEILAYMKG